MAMNLKGKKVLVLNLGLLGGGVATTNWLLDQGAHVAVTDLADAKILAPSVKRVEEHIKKIAKDGKDYEKRRARLVWALGTHSNALVDASDLLVINPSVSINHPYVQRALAKNITVANEGTLFYDTWKKSTIGITGTRGKTTVANWTHHFIKGSLLTGNSTTKPFQSVMEDKAKVAVTEISSFILELFDRAERAPHIAVITNLYQDHLNRHGTMKGYAAAKANIFANQTTKDFLILNADNDYTSKFLDMQPKSKVKYFSLSPLAAGLDGVWYADGAVWAREGKKELQVLDVPTFKSEWGMHNVANLLASALAAHLAGVTWANIQSAIGSLSAVQYRQEVVFKNRTLTVVNDTTATSPDGGIAALERWGGPNCILITGGTDRELDFREWAKALPKYITTTNTIFLAGSATQKMKKALGLKLVHGTRTYDSLAKAWKAARTRATKFVSATILFSPSAKSFELFKNEFDRGEQFNALVKRDLK